MRAKELKNSILQLAVSGKLVPQDASDEPAIKLLERIHAERESLVRQKKIKNTKVEPITEDEIPFEVPESWEWLRFSDIVYNAGNKTNQIKTKEIAKEGRYPVISQSSVQYIDGYYDGPVKPITSMPVLLFGDHTRAVKYINQPFIIGADGTKCLNVITIYPKYLYFVMNLLAENLRNRGYARHYSLLKKCPIPLPPLAEQKRIVQKVQELMPLVEEYGELEEAREKLDAELPSLLKKSVLQQAVQGKLVPQDATDEPAVKLLERIRVERNLKKVEPIEDAPFEIPSNWVWTRLKDVCVILRGSGIKRSEVTDTGLPCVRYGELYITYNSAITNVKSHTTANVYVSAKKLEPNEVLMTLTGENDIDIGRAVVNRTSETLAFGGDLLALKGGKINGDYLALAINSTVIGQQRTGASSGNIIVHLSAKKIEQFLLPLPPLAEQKRIVQKVQEVMGVVES